MCNLSFLENSNWIPIGFLFPNTDSIFDHTLPSRCTIIQYNLKSNNLRRFQCSLNLNVIHIYPTCHCIGMLVVLLLLLLFFAFFVCLRLLVLCVHVYGVEILSIFVSVALSSYLNYTRNHTLTIRLNCIYLIPMFVGVSMDRTTVRCLFEISSILYLDFDAHTNRTRIHFSRLFEQKIKEE